ncbi:MAG: hypothetical protein LBD77_05800 [Bifidobacteriaceae bacterium]|jgi:hypothetical protein|nr:hypothetical protein [Bifidobacteriaceae bacterium]
MNWRIVAAEAGSSTGAEWRGLVERVYPDRRFRGGQAHHEAALLASRHPLSADLDFRPLLAVDRHGRAAGRCAVCFRSGSSVARLGFFECLDLAAAPALLAAAEALAADRGALAIRGPFDPDYWVGYRMKLDHFDVPPFFGEPFNRPEYPGLWEASGYEVTGRYHSSVVARPRVPADGPWRPAAVRAHAQANGVEVRPLGLGFEAALAAIHGLVMDRFAIMAEFHPLTFDQFAALLRPLGRLLDRRASQLAWADERLVGFAAVTPDFGRSLDSGPARALAAIFARRLRPGALICSYLAVDRAYRGLGPALTLPGLARAARLGVPAIGALIHEDAPTAHYLPDQITRSHHYALYSKSLA